MPTATRTFRVFVSSTFEDLKDERDALQRDVFPRLCKLCEANNARFQAIDLRWGVRDEAALDQQTMEICLREIERCQQTGIKPNFIVMLGERYGWRPLPARIEATEFEQALSVASYADRQRLLWEESPTGSRGWYRLDLNAVPSEYILRPREVNVAPEASEADQQAARDHEAADWKLTEKELQKIFSSAIAHLNWPTDDPRRIKYEASATHQEILKGLGHSEEERKHVFAFFRESAEGTTIDPELTGLQQELSDKLPEQNILPFSASDLAKLCSDVERKLSAVILAEAERFKPQHALDLEMAEHQAFARDRANHFRGRVSVLEAIEKHIRGGEIRPLVVHGPSGCGKSAIMARAAKLAEGWAPGAQLIERFIGVTPDSSNGITLWTSLCQQLSRVYGATEETPLGFQPLVSAFHERMARASAEKPLVVFIDALDQLRSDDEVRSFTWLRQNLPPHISLIVSATEVPAGLTHAVQAEVEDFRVEEAAEVLAAWFAAARPVRKLQPEQREKVLGSFAQSESRLPLYLKLAFEEARRWRSFQPLEKCVLGGEVGVMIDVLFSRLSEQTNHGPVLVNRSLGFLAAARYGLSEDEMLDMLTADDAVWQDFESRAHHKPPVRQLPVIVWSRLFLDLAPYLNERAAPGGMVIAFYHRKLAERVMAKFLPGDEKQARHRDLARYFHVKTAWLDEGHKTPNARRGAELVFQQREARQWAEAEETLFDCAFLFSKVAAGMVLDLDLDYETLLRNAPESRLANREALRLVHGALQLSMHVVARDPRQFASQIIGRLLPDQELCAIQQFTASVVRTADRPWLRPLNPALDPPGTALLRTLLGHSLSVNAVAVTPDGRRAVSASEDGTLKVWDVESGRELRTLVGHSSSVNDATVSADGKLAFSASDDNTLKVWDVQSGRALYTLIGHTDRVNAVAVSAEGTLAVSASADGSLKVWDVQSGREQRTLVGHSCTVNDVAISEDGRMAVSASGDRTLMVWDVYSGRELRTLAGHSEYVYGVAMSGDGRWAVSASGDKTVKVWDIEGGRELRTLAKLPVSSKYTGYQVAMSGDGRRAVSASWDETMDVWDVETGRKLHSLEGHSIYVAMSGDGRRVVSTSWNDTLRVWDVESERKLSTPEGHSGSVNGVALSGDGRAVSAFKDGTLKVWDLESGRELRTLVGHTSSVESVAISGDGRRAVSASSEESLLYKTRREACLKVWDVERGRELRTLGEAPSSYVPGLAMSGDGRRAISASWGESMTYQTNEGLVYKKLGGCLKVWDVESGREQCTLWGHSDDVEGVAMSGDGRLAISASRDTTLKVWDVESASELRTLVGHSCSVNGVAMSSDGRLAVSAAADEPLRVWDVESGRELRTLVGGPERVNGVAMSGDGRLAISASVDHTLKVWEVASGLCLATFSCGAPVLCCAMSEGFIVAGDAAGRVHFLTLEE